MKDCVDKQAQWRHYYYMKFMDVLNNLHTVHGNFSDKPISDSDLALILASCVKGANAANRQSYSNIVIRGTENVKKITGCGFGSPVALVFCADYNRVYRIGERLGYQCDYDNLFYYLTAHTDAVIAAQTAVMTAASLGIGNMYTNSIHNLPRKDIAELCGQLEIPEEHCFPVTAVLLGYESGEAHPKAGKLSGKGVIHYDKYTQLTSSEADDLIAAINNPDNHFGSANDCKDYLEFFYSKRDAPKQREAVEKVDNALLAKLKSFLKL
jgi:nitroreductase